MERFGPAMWKPGFQYPLLTTCLAISLWAPKSSHLCSELLAVEQVDGEPLSAPVAQVIFSCLRKAGAFFLPLRGLGRKTG